MIYLVKNRKTNKEYSVDEKTYKTLDMKRKFELISSYDEKEKRVPIPDEIVIKRKVTKGQTND